MTDTPPLLDLLSQQRVLSSHIEEEARKVLGDNERLRAAMIRSGRAVGCLLADNVSTEFLLLVPAEIEARLAKLRDTQP
jgi:hypothetical protein